METLTKHLLESNVVKSSLYMCYSKLSIVCMQLKLVYNKRCSPHLRPISVISIIQLANRSTCIQYYYVQNSYGSLDFL